MLTSKVLYFPYIALPRSRWLIQTLLYWDEIATITPQDFIEDPDRHEKITRQLIREGLVTQIIPSWHLDRVPSFVPAFMEYLDSLGADQLGERRRRFESTKGFLIHVEKLYSLQSELAKTGLTRQAESPWMEVERDTATEFMVYLAATLGRLPDLGYAPVTDDEKYLAQFTRSSPHESATSRIDVLRVQVLDDLLPGPKRGLTVRQVAEFRARHGEQLRNFRRNIEQQLTTIADINDEALRERRLQLLLEEAQDEVDEIQNRMTEAGWGDLILGKFCAVLAAVPGASPLFGLANAVYAALGAGRQLDVKSPYLYAVHARELLGA